MADGTPGEGVGVLCADDRDAWTEVCQYLTCDEPAQKCRREADSRQFRRELMDYSPNNTPAIQAIESAILVVSLDDHVPTSEDGRAWSYWSGGIDRKASSGHGSNRWFDKHNIIVDESGESGFNGERKSPKRKRKSQGMLTDLSQTRCLMEHPPFE